MEKVQIFDAQEASKVAKEYLAGINRFNPESCLQF